MLLVPCCNFCGDFTDLTECEDCQVALYCSESHGSLDEESHESSCKALEQAKSFLKDQEFNLNIDAYDEDDDDFSRFVPIPVERLACNLNSYLNVPTYVAAGCQYIEALIKTNTFNAIRLAAEKACEMFRCFPSDPMDLRSDLPGVYLRLGRDQEAYSLVKWWQLNDLSDEDIHKSYPVVPYLDITDADVFEQPSDIINAIDGNPSLVNMFCVALIKIKILSDITVLQQIRALHQRLPPELVDMVERFIPLTDAVWNNPQVMSKEDYSELIEDVTDQVKVCFEAVEKANIHLWPSLINPDLRPGGTRHRPSNDKRTVDFVLDRCYDSWVETPGAVDIIRVLLNFPER
ncbi:MAG: hypothetical protein L6R42_007216 [Xanthoria sp. 1 TBL-2021]|nr:MAG: hypothetical protein L6R42_007216 [Xanthoria sp. 1 TBL-2021]